MDPNGRLRLNFGGVTNDYNAASNDRSMYPTTPSTFPQPIFSPNQPQNTQQDFLGPRLTSPTAGLGQGYFMNNPYAPQQQQPQQQPQNQYSNQQYQQQSLQSPQASYQPRNGNTGNTANDVPNSLINQFSNQDLGGGARNLFSRTPSPGISTAGQRPRTAGSTGQQGGQGPYASHLAPPMPSRSPRPEVEEDPPERNPDKYSKNIYARGKVINNLVREVFEANVIRARERNTRAHALEQKIQNSNWSEDRMQQERIQAVQEEARFLRFLRTKEDTKSFSTLKVIGKGAFGEVKLVQRKRDGQIYALKSLVKSEMFKKDQLAHVRAERDILTEAKESPWVVKLHACFQDTAFLYMLMEFLPGGDLMTMLIKYEIFSEDITRFYMAEITMAIEAVHKLHYIHRDIKPDNILLDRGGHIKLTDFGLSTGFKKQHENSYYQQLMKNASGGGNRNSMRNSVNLDQINLTVSNRGQINTWRKSRRVMAYSTVGTPDYIAPEIFTAQGYTYLCDWWSVGAIMFECLIGWPPFCAEDTHETYRKIVNWQESLYFPEDIALGREAENLIRSLLCDASNRLGKEGGDVNGATEIKNHPFFRGVIWDKLRAIRAPFEPKLTSNVDTSYFPIDEIPQEDTSAVHRAQANALTEHSAEMSLPFIGYTYKAFNAYNS